MESFVLNSGSVTCACINYLPNYFNSLVQLRFSQRISKNINGFRITCCRKQAAFSQACYVLGLASYRKKCSVVQLVQSCFPCFQRISLRIFTARFLLQAHLVQLLNSTRLWRLLSAFSLTDSDRVPSSFTPGWVTYQPFQLAPAKNA